MTRGQNVVIAALSLFATTVILMQGVGVAGSDLTIPASLRKPLTVTAALPSAGGLASSDESDSSDDDGDVSDGDGGGASDAFVSEAPVASAPVDDTSDDDVDTTPTEEEPQPSKIKHVFVITLAGHGYDATFGPASTAPYLSQQLRPQGALLTGYRSLGRADLPDYLAMIGGQPPNDDTRAGCPSFKEIPPTASPSQSGEISESGCVFPNTVTTVADQISAKGLAWGAYVEDLDRGPKGAIMCRRPDSNALDDTLKARPGDGYATRHNPFVYFHSLLDLSDCDAKDGPLGKLETDLVAVKTTPNFSFIAPNLCNDGSESPCVDGSPGGLPAADAFLANWVPKILASPAYKQDGLLIVTFAGSVAAAGDPAAADAPAVNGTLLVSRYAQAGSTVGGDYDPYSLLRSVEDLFALKPLARAATAQTFADTVLSEALVTPVSDG